VTRTHLISIYRKSVGAKDATGAAATTWTSIATGVSANLQPMTGSVKPKAVGRDTEAIWKGFVPAGTDVQVDDGILVTTGVGPSRFLVGFEAPEGAPWDIELHLEDTEIEFDA